MKIVAALTLAILAASPALAQDAVQTAPTAAPEAAAPQTPAPQVPGEWAGLTIAEVTGQLTAAGLVVDPPVLRNDRAYLRVTDGPIRWILTLFACTGGACPDVQFTAIFSGPQATPEVIGRWNAERRFVKASHAAPAEGETEARAFAQYDVLLVPGAGPTQLDDPIQVWRSLIVDLGRTVTPAPAAE